MSPQAQPNQSRETPPASLSDILPPPNASQPATRRITVRLPTADLTALDARADALNASRSDYLRTLIALRGKDMDSTGDWMAAVRDLVYSWDPVEEALIASGCQGAPSVDRVIEDFKSTYESSICGIEAVCQIVTNAWDEKTAAEGTHSESLDQMCERASSAIDGAMDDSRAVERSENIDK